jgi:hypothetical protein
VRTLLYTERKQETKERLRQKRKGYLGRKEPGEEYSTVDSKESGELKAERKLETLSQ